MSTAVSFTSVTLSPRWLEDLGMSIFIQTISPTVLSNTCWVRSTCFRQKMYFSNSMCTKTVVSNNSNLLLPRSTWLTIRGTVKRVGPYQHSSWVIIVNDDGGRKQADLTCRLGWFEGRWPLGTESNESDELLQWLRSWMRDCKHDSGLCKVSSGWHEKLY